MKDKQISQQDIYSHMTKYLKKNNLHLELGYFSGILKATGQIVLENRSFNEACKLCSMMYHSDNTQNGHLRLNILKKHVKEIVATF